MTQNRWLLIAIGTFLAPLPLLWAYLGYFLLGCLGIALAIGATMWLGLAVFCLYKGLRPLL